MKLTPEQIQTLLINLIVMLLGMFSLAIWFSILGRRFSEKPDPVPMNQEVDVQRDRHPLAVLVMSLLVTVQLGGTALALAKPAKAAEPATLKTIYASCALNLGITLLLLLLLSNFGRNSLKRIGIDADPPRKDLLYAVQGCFASFLPVYMVNILLYLVGVRKAENQHLFIQLMKENSSLEIAFWMFLAAGVLAPLAEELLFRVTLQGWLEKIMQPAKAIVLVAALFSFVHGWPDMVALFPLALILGYIYHRRRRYLTVVLLHMIFNSINLIIALLSSNQLPP